MKVGYVESMEVLAEMQGKAINAARVADQNLEAAKSSVTERDVLQAKIKAALEEALKPIFKKFDDDMERDWQIFKARWDAIDAKYQEDLANV